MYEIDPRFIDSDGGIRVEEAIEAGRRERAEAMGGACRAIRLALRRLRGRLAMRASRYLACAAGRLRDTRTAA